MKWKGRWTYLCRFSCEWCGLGSGVREDQFDGLCLSWIHLSRQARLAARQRERLSIGLRERSILGRERKGSLAIISDRDADLDGSPIRSRRS